jgi:hypothetical protein
MLQMGVYIYIPIARGKRHLQYQVIRLRVNSRDMLTRKFYVDSLRCAA